MVGWQIKLGGYRLLMLFISCVWFSAHSQEKLLIIDAESWLSPEHENSFQAKLVKSVLAQYEGPYLISVMPRNRGRQTLLKHPSACSPWILKNPEREKHYQFSAPYMMESRLRLMLDRTSEWGKTLAKFEGEAPISLELLLNSRKFPVLGIESERSYGKTTDELLAKLGKTKAVYKRTSSTDSVYQLQPMLHHGFIDMMIEYEKPKEGPHEDKFYYLDYQETEPFQLVYFACSKSATIAPILNKLNAAIERLSHSADYQKWVLDHLPMNEREKALAYWQNALNNNK
ncbi:hypothetical protein PALB_28400 [Pseudoalteromonas luteoviolacea B = ATCC 29581]|nr:hypothetical protein PALB_28400 [Pseudoalteromonas luteoviolacea B = ATCC 29581]